MELRYFMLGKVRASALQAEDLRCRVQVLYVWRELTQLAVS